ncbi:MAG: phosphate ABC transporter permease subunit PstC [Chloroflexota bacterium]|nr:phosphate ABC transporter permease subunit PstC [Chloroflexota bacterium]
MRWRERISRIIFAGSAGLVVLIMASVILFVGSNAYQTFTVYHVNPFAFFFGAQWAPDQQQVGSLVLITGSVLATLLAVLVGTPISVGVALFVTEIAPPWARKVMQPVIELLTGIPSIIYGFMGLVVIVPLIAKTYNYIAGAYLTTGFGIIAATVVLTVMILPTITSIAIDSLSALPVGLREASLALGATRWQTIRRTLLPAGSSGILTGVVLGMGRAVGETLAVSYVIGSNANSFPIHFTNVYPYINFTPTSTITVQLLFDFAEARNPSLNYNAIWTLAFTLLVISFLLVAASRWIASRGAYSAPSVTSAPRPPLLQRAIAAGRALGPQTARRARQTQGRAS